MDIIKNISELLQAGKARDVKALVQQAIDEGIPASVILDEGLLDGMGKLGVKFKNNEVFVPEVLVAARALNFGTEVLKAKLLEEGVQRIGKVVIGTVKGDIHDIGKNIVKVLLENYSFDVIDLGKDVPPEVIVDTAVEQDIRLVGLSALMTTTVVSMEETIKLLRERKPECKVMVGGAVLNQDYADMIGADFYGKDAMQSVYYAQRVFEEE